MRVLSSPRFLDSSSRFSSASAVTVLSVTGVSGALHDFNFPVPYPNFTVHPTTSAGPETKIAQEIAHATLH
jgi:hypothetical protein